MEYIIKTKRSYRNGSHSLHMSHWCFLFSTVELNKAKSIFNKTYFEIYFLICNLFIFNISLWDSLEAFIWIVRSYSPISSWSYDCHTTSKMIRKDWVKTDLKSQWNTTSWWRHDKKTIPALVTLCEWNVKGGLSSQWANNAELWCLLVYNKCLWFIHSTPLLYIPNTTELANWKLVLIWN